MVISNKDLGVIAYGVKTGIITFEDCIVEDIKNTFKKSPELIQNNDILCVTEAVVAITQDNRVTIDEVSNEIRQKLKLRKDSTIGVIHPILSRNRFSMILKAIARAVPEGRVIVQLRFLEDEQGNPITTKEILNKIGKGFDDKITLEELGENRHLHPETGLDYINFYEEIIRGEGSKPEIFLGNSTEYIVEKNPDGIIVSDVHTRHETLEKIRDKGYSNAITLQDICSSPDKKAYSEYGLLGSNISDPAKELLKLSPREPDKVCEDIKKMIKTELKKDVEVIINGDGAYKDPESVIYELADPVSVFGCTERIKHNNRQGVKTKYLVQKLHNEGKTKQEIERLIEEEKKKFRKEQKKDHFSGQGTTPRKIKNLVASLADLITGSGDENTPFVVVRGFLKD